MILRPEGGTAPSYGKFSRVQVFICVRFCCTKENINFLKKLFSFTDSIHDALKISMKVTHGGFMKHQPKKHYFGGHVQFIDHVDVSEIKLYQFKNMAEICGYDNESVAFWHKYGRLGEKMRLVSTDFKANLVCRNIPRDKVIEVYFEHLDSYIGMDISMDINNNVEQNRKEGRAEYSSSDDDFEDSDNDLSDEHDILERSENGTREYEVSEEVRKKWLMKMEILIVSTLKGSRA